MESEKVKEIKKALKYCCGECDCDCPFYKNGKSYEECKSLLLFEALTLINELESEKQKLAKAGKRVTEINKELSNVHKKIEEQLKERIAELEKENANKTETITDLLKKQEFYEKQKLKQFAEMLKDRLRYTSPTSDVLELRNLEFDGIEVEQCIDETLKEFINE